MSALEFFLSSEHWLDAITLPLEAHMDRLAHTVTEYLVEQGWTGAKGTGAPAAPPTAAAEPLPEENVGETRRPDLVSNPSPSGVHEPPLAVPESAQEEAASIAEATEKTKVEDAPAQQMEPPAQVIEDVAEAIEGPASRAKTEDANHGAPSRFAPLSAPVQADLGLAENAQMEPPARKLPSEGAIPLPPPEEKTPLLQTRSFATRPGDRGRNRRFLRLTNIRR